MTKKVMYLGEKIFSTPVPPKDHPLYPLVWAARTQLADALSGSALLNEWSLQRKYQQIDLELLSTRTGVPLPHLEASGQTSYDTDSGALLRHLSPEDVYEQGFWWDSLQLMYARFRSSKTDGAAYGLQYSQLIADFLGANPDRFLNMDNEWGFLWEL